MLKDIVLAAKKNGACGVFFSKEKKNSHILYHQMPNGDMLPYGETLYTDKDIKTITKEINEAMPSLACSAPYEVRENQFDELEMAIRAEYTDIGIVLRFAYLNQCSNK